jgi:hypothetical protein
MRINTTFYIRVFFKLFVCFRKLSNHMRDSYCEDGTTETLVKLVTVAILLHLICEMA